LRETVLDASVVLKWFQPEGEGDLDAARKLREDFEAGEMRILAPPLLWLEILNVAARRWRWDAVTMGRLAAMLPALGFELVEPEMPVVARWAAAGLTAYDAAYVAVAEQSGSPLVTDDAEILRMADTLATPLVS
jgi:predicted nucleic acid-binding protein